MIQAVALAENNGLIVPNRYGDVPLKKRDPTTWDVTQGSNPANADEYDYWDHVDFVIAEAAKRNRRTPIWNYIRPDLKLQPAKPTMDMGFAGVTYTGKTHRVKNSHRSGRHEFHPPSAEHPDWILVVKVL